MTDFDYPVGKDSNKGQILPTAEAFARPSIVAT